MWFSVQRLVLNQTKLQQLSTARIDTKIIENWWINKYIKTWIGRKISCKPFAFHFKQVGCNIFIPFPCTRTVITQIHWPSHHAVSVGRCEFNFITTLDQCILAFVLLVSIRVAVSGQKWFGVTSKFLKQLLTSSTSNFKDHITYEKSTTPAAFSALSRMIDFESWLRARQRRDTGQ